MKKQKKPKSVTIKTYSEFALPHLQSLIHKNHKVMDRLAKQVITNVKKGRSLLVFGSGHSSIFPMELYHRAGGASFVLPLFADFLLPTAGPPVVRLLERTEGSANFLLERFRAQEDEMIWIASQSGINPAGVDLALSAKKRGLKTVAFTSVVHSKAVRSRHSSGKRLFEVCDEVVDLGGGVGDALVPVAEGVQAGPMSTLGCVFLGHSILVAAMARLEAKGVRCVYTSVNTPQGESRNQALEEIAKERDFLLR